MREPVLGVSDVITRVPIGVDAFADVEPPVLRDEADTVPPWPTGIEAFAEVLPADRAPPAGGHDVRRNSWSVRSRQPTTTVGADVDAARPLVSEDCAAALAAINDIVRTIACTGRVIAAPSGGGSDAQC
jgi:hypothetical protein